MMSSRPLLLLLLLLLFEQSECATDRDIASVRNICRLACISRCISGGEQMTSFSECEEQRCFLRKFQCEDLKCLPKFCRRIIDSGESESFEGPFRRLRFGQLNPRRTYSSITLNWTMPDEIIKDDQGPVLFFVEENNEENDTWSAQNATIILTNPEVTFSELCEEHEYRMVAVNAQGLVAVSPKSDFHYAKSQLLPVSSTRLSGLMVVMNDRVRGVLSWKLPEGFDFVDVKRYSISPATKYCETISIPTVSLVAAGKETRANVGNLRLDCRYGFNVSFTTFCDGNRSSPVGQVDITIRCQDVAGAVCGQGLVLGKEPGEVVITSVNVHFNDTTQIWANITWEPPKDLGSSTELVGYEIWWGAAHNLQARLGLPIYEFSGKIDKIHVSANTTSIFVRDLSNGTLYGVKVAAIGNILYNVSSVLPYKALYPFDTAAVFIYNDELRSNLSSGQQQLVLYICVPLLTCFLLAGVGLLCRRKLQHQTPGFGIKRNLVRSGPLMLRYKTWEDASKDGSKYPQPPLTPDRWELPRSRIVLGQSLGKGAFGEVFKGKIRGTILISTDSDGGGGSKIPTEKYTNFTVAVKLLPAAADSREKESFLREIQVMKDIGYHKHIVSLIGCCILTDPICLVEEHCPLGDLQKFLSYKRQNVDHLDVDPLTLKDLLSFARQIALGMDYIHRKGYVHRDLAARNMLLVDQRLVKIGDFGLTRYIYEDRIYVMQNAGKLPIKWMALESIFDLTFTAASDVWAFGVVLFEIITLGGTPYPTINNKDLLNELKNGYRMEIPDNCPSELYSLMLRCWQKDPNDRPNFSVLCKELEQLLEFSAGDESYLQLNSNQDYYVIVSAQEDVNNINL